MATSGALVSAQDALSETYDGLPDTKGAVVLTVVALSVTSGREVLHLSFTTVPFLSQITCRPLHPAVAFVAFSGAVALSDAAGCEAFFDAFSAASSFFLSSAFSFSS